MLLIVHGELLREGEVQAAFDCAPDRGLDGAVGAVGGKFEGRSVGPPRARAENAENLTILSYICPKAKEKAV
jgi:hypothetical protein